MREIEWSANDIFGMNKYRQHLQTFIKFYQKHYLRIHLKEIRLYRVENSGFLYDSTIIVFCEERTEILSSYVLYIAGKSIHTYL